MLLFIEYCRPKYVRAFNHTPYTVLCSQHNNAALSKKQKQEDTLQHTTITHLSCIYTFLLLSPPLLFLLYYS